MKKNAEIMVSIFVLTYNQEKFIIETLNSLLDQETNFFYNIIIGDDASTDGTSIICASFKDCFPDKIIYNRNQTNQGLIKNFIKTSKFLNGKYVAICDGDDYWIDTLKLQKQVDFLESHKDFSIVAAQARRLDTKGGFTEPKINTRRNFTIESLILDNLIIAPTVMFKNFNQLQHLPKWFENLPYGDWPVYILLLKETKDKVAIFPDVLAVYRTEIGTSAKLIKNLPALFSVKLMILSHLKKEPSLEEYKELIDKSLYRSKINKMTSLNGSRVYFKSFWEMLNIISRKPSFKVLKIYIYSILKSIRKF